MQLFMQFLYDKYIEHLAELDDAKPDFDDFVNWATSYLSEVNPPIRSFYPGVGIGLQLSHNDFVVFTEQIDDSTMAANVVPITGRNFSVPGTDLIPDQSIPITGTK